MPILSTHPRLWGLQRFASLRSPQSGGERGGCRRLGPGCGPWGSSQGSPCPRPPASPHRQALSWSLHPCLAVPTSLGLSPPWYCLLPFVGNAPGRRQASLHWTLCTLFFSFFPAPLTFQMSSVSGISARAQGQGASAPLSGRRVRASVSLSCFLVPAGPAGPGGGGSL